MAVTMTFRSAHLGEQSPIRNVVDWVMGPSLSPPLYKRVHIRLFLLTLESPRGACEENLCLWLTVSLSHGLLWRVGGMSANNVTADGPARVAWPLALLPPKGPA